ncbi:MAG: hypothetical protein HIU91_00935 [Acidobacteria bacterium]|nr:hypothetical protein [Acidobacteriota bacterium]
MSLILVSAWACFALQAVNYAAFSLFVTLYIVYLFRFGGFSQTTAGRTSGCTTRRWTGRCDRRGCGVEGVCAEDALSRAKVRTIETL